MLQIDVVSGKSESEYRYPVQGNLNRQENRLEFNVDNIAPDSRIEVFLCNPFNSDFIFNTNGKHTRGKNTSLTFSTHCIEVGKKALIFELEPSQWKTDGSISHISVLQRAMGWQLHAVVRVSAAPA